MGSISRREKGRIGLNMKRYWTVHYLLIGLSVLALTLGGYLYLTSGSETSSREYLTVKVERGAIRRTVSATGTLQAVMTVQVGSQVSGRIQELHADFNSVVKKGKILALIDPANFEAQRERARAFLATAHAAVKNTEANLVNREAELSSAKANLQVHRVAEKEAERQLRRNRELFEGNLVPERDLENTQSAFEQSTARVQQAEAQVSQVKASILSASAQRDQALANVKQAQAELQMAEVNLRYTKITSPIDGVVIERNVDIGQTVAASFQAPVIFLIANDLSKMQVIAQIDEADIGVISEKAGVDFTVDAFAGESFQGKISEIRLSSTLPMSSTISTSAAGGGATNVVVYNVMIDVDNIRLKLRPSMTANVKFTVASVEDTLKVANAALRYRPSGIVPDEGKTRLARFSTDESRLTDDKDSLLAEESDLRKGQGESESPGGQGGPEKQQRWKGESRDSGGTARESAHTQTVIGPSTIEQYGIKTGPKIRFPEAEKPPPIPGVVWVLDADSKPQRRGVKLGITDGKETAIMAGDLKEGEAVITWEIDDEEELGEARSPFGGVFGSRRRSGTRGSSRTGRRGGNR